MTRLAIVETDDTGKVSSIVRDIEDCTSAEWDEIMRITQENAEKARLLTDNEVKLNLLLQGMASAGLFRENKLDLYPTLKPCFETFMAEYEQKKGLAKRFDAWQRKMRTKLLKKFFDVAGTLISDYLKPKK